jgi:hypothetical protein
MRTSSALFAVLTAGSLLVGIPAAQAQGNLSTQGFGYPPGQLSTRALGAGGSTAELDPVSPINPAAIINWGASSVFFQAAPEFRSLEANGRTQRSMTSRYPLTTGTLALSSSMYLSLSTSTLLDRTWGTTEEGAIDLGGTPVSTLTSYSSQGAINDIRLAGAYAVYPWLRVGAGVHAITGRNLVSIVSTFSDSTAFSPLITSSVISYGGNTFSAGAEARIGRNVAVAASARAGGSMSAERNDSTLSSAAVPSKFGLAIGYMGARGSTIAVRASRDGWSSLSSLGGSEGFEAHDTWDLGAGADVPGPRFGRNVIQLRAGVRRRMLPFEAAGERVTENSVSFGSGTVFANGRVYGDLGVVRAARSVPSGNASEGAWTLSFGLSVRP